MSQQQPNAPVVNPFNVMNTWLHAKPCEGSQKRPTLRFGLFKNQPRVTVRTNVPGDKDHGKIEFNTDLATFACFIKFAMDLIEGKTEDTERVFVYRNNFVAGKKRDNFIELSKLHVGRAQDGRIYIAVLSTQPDRPKIKFFFGPSHFHDIRKADGSQLSPKEMSDAYAYGFLDPAYKLVMHLLVTEFDPDAKGVSNPANFNQGNGNSGGYNNGGQRNNYNNGSNNSYAKPANNSYNDSAFDEDMPSF